MTKATILSATALACLFLPSCVAGGSGVRLEAKKNAGAIDLKIRYWEFRGNGLRKLKTCVVQYGSASSIESTKIVAREHSRGKDSVEWVASVPNRDGAKELPVRLTMMTEEMIGRNTTTDWLVKPRTLTGNYQLVAP